jgi:hypothetical protein
MADHIPKRFSTPVSTVVAVSLVAGLEVVAAASEGVAFAVDDDWTLVDKTDVEDADVLDGAADDASGSPSLCRASV